MYCERLLAVEARTAHVRLGLTYKVMIPVEWGNSKLESAAGRVRSVGKSLSSCVRPDSRGRLSPHECNYVLQLLAG